MFSQRVKSLDVVVSPLLLPSRKSPFLSVLPFSLLLSLALTQATFARSYGNGSTPLPERADVSDSSALLIEDGPIAQALGENATEVFLVGICG